MYQNVLKLIEQYESIIVLRHIGPDPDALGSQFGIAQLIKDNFQNKTVLCGGLEASPLQPEFFPVCDVIADDVFKESLVIVCDCANAQRVDDQRFLLAPDVIKFDHHPAYEPYGTLQVVDESANATCQMVVAFIMTYDLKLHVSPVCATYLYMGLVSDTGRFLHNTITANTLQAGAFLVGKHANISLVHESLYLRNTNEIKLQAYILSNFTMSDKGVAYYYLLDETIKASGVDAQVAKEFVHVLGNLKEAKIWVSFTYDAKAKLYRCSVRSRHIQINEVAQAFGGGGHRFASGVKLEHQEQCEQLIVALEELI